MLGNFVSGPGTQAALVALPYQVYVETRSALLTGLLGARRARTACVAAAGVVVLAFPALARYDKDEAIAAMN